MNKDEIINECLLEYRNHHPRFNQFLNAVRDYFELEPPFNDKSKSVIHSIKYRLKDPTHLQEKLERKWNDRDPITQNNLFERITDFAGLRVLHLYQDQFPVIHEKIKEKVNSGDWFFVEKPKAYTWDPETVKFFEDLDIESHQKESHYTSIHYLIKPKEISPYICEIQVRTLFEEIWGEIDHTLNYPYITDSIACKEQIRVLSKLVSTGTRLADSIFRSYKDHIS